jgi:hypothetical protein
MYKKYVKAEGENVTPSLVQIFENDTIGDLPEVTEKGINLKEPIGNSYKASKYFSSVKLANDIIVTAIQGTIYVSKFENFSIKELKKFVVYNDTSTRVNVRVDKVVKLNDTTCLIVNNAINSLNAYLLTIDSDTFTLSDKFILVSSGVGNQYDVEVLTPNRVIVGFGLNNNTSATVTIIGSYTPYYLVLNISDNKVTLPSPMLSFGNFPTSNQTEEKKINPSCATIYCSKISSNEFLGAYTLDSDRNNNVMCSVFRVDSQEVLHEHDSMSYLGYESQYHSILTPKAIYLSDYKVITFECLGKTTSKFQIVLRNIVENNGTYSYNTLSSLDLTNYTTSIPLKVDLIKVYTDGSKDFIMFNRYIVHIDAGNNTLTLINSMNNVFNAKSSNQLNNIVNSNQTIYLENNLILDFNDNNDFQMIKYDEYNGLPLGIVKRKKVN